MKALRSRLEAAERALEARKRDPRLMTYAELFEAILPALPVATDQAQRLRRGAIEASAAWLDEVCSLIEGAHVYA